jgi:cell division transport system permease protein
MNAVTEADINNLKKVASEQAKIDASKKDLSDTTIQRHAREQAMAAQAISSLEIRAKSINSLLEVIENINKAKETNPHIDEVMYFKDVVDNMRTLSRIINVGSVILISAMAIVTVSLIRVTIGFNIKLHQKEIEIMHLVGSSDKFIRRPFLLEGTFYGIMGGLIASLLIIIPWYSVIYYTQGTDFSFWVNQLLLDFNLPFLLKIEVGFLLAYLLTHMIVGGLFGYFSSYSAVKKYLK